MAEGKQEQPKSDLAKREEEVLEFWRTEKVFEQSLAKQSPKGEFVFYEGPPTANGKPGIHHLEARAFKDVITRYRTMSGYHVRRKGGWDTHGLPVELQVEKQLGLKSKKEIEAYGIAKFNEQCKRSVWEYLGLWEKFTDRMGYWVDQQHPYVTYHNEYIESLWSIFKKVKERELLYKDYKVVPWCPRCGTALSSHELGQPDAYVDVKDLTITAKFHLKPGQKWGNDYVIGETAYILAWTTTPWTLPGNVALAVGEKIKYTAIRVKGVAELYILASERVATVFKDQAVEIVHEDITGSDLVGLSYEPLYPFLKTEFESKNQEVFSRAYQVYAADFVNTEDGTGVVHIAPMYGQDDFELGTKVGLPKFHIVRDDGTFDEATGFLVSKFVKAEEVAVDIIKDLATRGLLFKKEKYEHSYPHCWRCQTPLIYYARDSWYIRMSALRDELVKENETINWEPKNIRDGRFGEWLREVKDWAISRERYWGTPLPIWQDEAGNIEVIGSITELKDRTVTSGNKYFVMRHGEGDHNIQRVLSGKADNPHHLTVTGQTEVVKGAQELKDKKINLIISSDFIRGRETAEIVARELGLDPTTIIYDPRLREINFGEYEGRSFDEYHEYLATIADPFDNAVPGGESFSQIKDRVGEFLYDIDKRYQHQNIILVTHESPAWLLEAVTHGQSGKEAMTLRPSLAKGDYMPTGSTRSITFVPLPHNEHYELDLHRPYIDEIKLVSKEGKGLTRVKEVMDVWFDSGAMPFAQDHYPFENKERIEGAGYPADYISEAIDQTRGWFYTLHAVGVLMGRGKAFKNVICLGHILDAQGKKMSKSLGNVVDPWTMFDKYGADALRLWMYSVNQPGDSKNFDEQTVDEVVKKVFNLTDNILAFYKLYNQETIVPRTDSPYLIDQWILARLNLLVKEGGESLEAYKVFEAARAIRSFVNDFSTWYIRRSRERFKSNDIADRDAAVATTLQVIRELAKYLAPFVPMYAEYLFGQTRIVSDPTSVHLTDFPQTTTIATELLEAMEKTREIVSLALEKRMAGGLKVRQPLARLTINTNLDEAYRALIKEELNVKEVVVDTTAAERVILDTTLTPELKLEGKARELMRQIQEQRKQQGFSPQELVILTLEAKPQLKEVVGLFEDLIKKGTSSKEIIWQIEVEGASLVIDEDEFKMALSK